jgi:hypothetical protein
LDILRIFENDHSKEILLSSSDDGTIKVWLTNPNTYVKEKEPFIPK